MGLLGRWKKNWIFDKKKTLANAMKVREIRKQNFSTKLIKKD